ncbi:MAG: IclR family transcriptional regulator, partial [Nocardioidaceae bacterium]
GNTVVQVAQVDSTYLLSATNWVDVDVPPHASALGKVFYAAGMIEPPDTFPRLTANTITDIDKFRRHLDKVRRQGFAVTGGELEIGLDAVATPVLNHTGDVVAALGVSGPSERIGRQLPALERLLKSHARALSHELGHQARKEGAA